MAGEAGVNQLHVIPAMSRALGKLMKLDDSVDAKEFQKINAFEATFNYDWSTYAGDANPHLKKHIANHLTGLSTLMWIESNAVRRPASHMFLEMLREIGYERIAKDPGEIYRVAKEMTDHYMVSTRFYEKPHVFSRTGLFGMAVGPLQSFATTWLGMLREYSKLSFQGLKEGSLSKQVPLASFFAGSLLTTGMLGFVGVKEWDALAEFLNKQFGFNLPTGTEYILSNVKSTKLRHGALTEALGLNVGATFGAPTMTGSLAPGLQFYGALANMGLLGVRQTGVFGEANVPQSAEWREGIKGWTPRFSPLPEGIGGWGYTEQHFTPPGRPYEEASGRGGPIVRTPEDWAARRLGTYSLEESAQKIEHYTAQKRQKSLTKEVNRAVEIILNEPDKINEKLPVLWESLAEKQFTSQEIRSALLRKVQERLIEADVRGVKGGATARQQRLWLLYQQLQGQR